MDRAQPRKPEIAEKLDSLQEAGMSLTLYYHPFSSYCWKALIPLYEAGTPFAARRIDDPEAAAEWQRLWPIKRLPLLVDETRGLTLPEASIIIEYLDRHHPGPQPMLPADPDLCLETRLLDRYFDNYVHAALQRIVVDRSREAGRRDPPGVEEAHSLLDTSYTWLEARMTERHWAVGGRFTLADCAAAPALFYADWVHPLGDAFPHVAAYRARLLARPSIKRCIDDARPLRMLFPGGAPDRD